MAHFAELDRDDNVIRVILVSNDIETGEGSLGENDMHTRGEIWCEKFSWVLNRTTGEWDPPIARPTIKTGILDGIEYNYRGWWDEESQSFKAHLGQTNIYEWNTEILSWDLITVQAP